MYDAIVLAGGAASRLDGADKPGVEVGGRTLLDRVVRAASGAHRIVVVGPRRETEAEVVWTREDPPGGGPVAAIAAALPQLEQDWCLLLAADLPRVAGAVPVLLSAAFHADAAVLEVAGRRNHLAAAWRVAALRDAVRRIGEVRDAPAAKLYTGVRVTPVPDEQEWGRDCDTWADVERARSRERR